MSKIAMLSCPRFEAYTTLAVGWTRIWAAALRPANALGNAEIVCSMVSFPDDRIVAEDGNGRVQLVQDVDHTPVRMKRQMARPGAGADLGVGPLGRLETAVDASKS